MRTTSSKHITCMYQFSLVDLTLPYQKEYSCHKK